MPTLRQEVVRFLAVCAALIGLAAAGGASFAVASGHALRHSVEISFFIAGGLAIAFGAIGIGGGPSYLRCSYVGPRNRDSDAIGGLNLTGSFLLIGAIVVGLGIALMVL